MANYQEIIYENIKNYDDISKCNFYELATPFEYYSAIMLSCKYSKNFYHYNDLDIIYKEDNNLSKNDTGIDLCDKINTLVQVKLRKNTLNWSELSTFIASQNQYDPITRLPYIKWQNLILTRNSCSKLANNLLNHHSYNLLTDSPYELEQFYNYCNDLKNNPPITNDINLAIEDRDYQTYSIDLIKNNSDKNIYFCLPTGSGKTYIFIMSIDIEYDKKYIILVPLKTLLKQTKDEIIKRRPELTNYIQCIGDGNNKFDINKIITISTYHSVDLVGDLNNYNRVIIDEAHKIIKPQIYEEIEEDNDEDEEEDNIKYTTIIREHIDNNTNSLLFSATLDEPHNENDLFYKVKIRDLIDNNILTDYQIKIPIFQDNANDISICQYIIKNYNNMIIYTSSQKEGKIITDILNSISKNSSYYIDCNTPNKQRENILKDFKNGNIKYLVNVRILIEGFDAPICNGVILYNISSNDKTIIQIIGRALRKYKNKLYAYVVLPFINSEDSKNLNFILRVLANNDPEIHKRCINKKLGGYIDIDIIYEENNDIDEIEKQETLMENKFELVFDSLGNCIKGNTDMWLNRLEKLKEFIDNNGKTPSSKCKNREENTLGHWLSYQKTNYNKKKEIMKNKNIRKIWEDFIEEYKNYLLTYEELWTNNLENIKVFININGKRPSVYSKNKEQKTFGVWLRNQKTNYDNKKFIMKNEDIIKIWEDFIEEYKKYLLSGEELWLANLEKLKEFINNNGKTPSKYNKNIDTQRLGIWLSDKKKNYNDKQFIMKNEDIIKIWKDFIEEYKNYLLTGEELWLNNLEKIKEFININGKTPSQYNKNRQENILGCWLSTQKRTYNNKQNIMKNENIRKIWEDFIEEYKQFIITK
jgi:superfamily II DNA or RNA helicase